MFQKRFGVALAVALLTVSAQAETVWRVGAQERLTPIFANPIAPYNPTAKDEVGPTRHPPLIDLPHQPLPPPSSSKWPPQMMPAPLPVPKVWPGPEWQSRVPQAVLPIVTPPSR